MLPPQCFGVVHYPTLAKVTASLNAEVSQTYTTEVKAIGGQDVVDRCNVIAVSRLWDLVYGDIEKCLVEIRLEILRSLPPGSPESATQLAQIEALIRKLERKNVLNIIPQITNSVSKHV